MCMGPAQRFHLRTGTGSEGQCQEATTRTQPLQLALLRHTPFWPSVHGFGAPSEEPVALGWLMLVAYCCCFALQNTALLAEQGLPRAIHVP